MTDSNMQQFVGPDRQHVPMWRASGLAVALWVAAGAAVVLAGLMGLNGGPGSTLASLVAVAACLIGMAVLEGLRQRALLAMGHAQQTGDMLLELFQSLPVGIQIKDSDLRYVWINDVQAGVLKRKPSDMLGKTLAELGVDPVLVAQVNAHDRRVLESGKIDGPQEQFMRMPGGELVQVMVVTKIPLRQNGRVSHVATLHLDARKWDALQPRHEDARILLEAVMDAAPITVQVVDRDLRLFWANKAFQRLHGWTDPVVEGVLLADMARLPQLLPGTLAANDAIFSGASRRIEAEMFYPATDYRPETYILVTKVPIYDSNGRVDRILTMGTDITALKRSQIAAETANSLVDGILRHVPVNLHVKDSEQRFRWANAIFGVTTGKALEEVLGKTLVELGVNPESVERVAALDRQVLTTGATIRYDDFWEHPDGLHRVLVIKAPLLDSAGRPTHVITIGSDVDELYRLRAEADAARHRLQTVLDAVPVTIALKDPDRRYVWVNREFERVRGDDVGQMIGKRVDEFGFAPEVARQVEAMDKALLQGGAEPPVMQQDLITVTGELRNFSVRRILIRDAEGGGDGILVVGVDVTEVVKATAQLRQMNEELEQRVMQRAEELAQVNALVSTVIQSVPVPIVLFDQDRSIALWNPAAELVSGITAIEATKGTPGAAEGLLEQGFRPLIDMNMQGEPFADVELAVQRPAGDSIELLVSGAPLRRADGAIGGAVNIWLDVTERKRSAAQLAESNTSLESSNQILAATLAHMSQGVCFFDAESCLVISNRQFAELYALSEDDIRPGMSLREIHELRYAAGTAPVMGIDDYVRWRDDVRRQGVPSESQVTLNNGRIIAISHHPLPDGGWVATHEDITERLRTEDMLRQAQKLESVGRLTAGIAHDFNNLLQSVVIALEMVAGTDEVASDKMLNGLVQNALLAVTSGGELTQQLLAFSRKQMLKPSRVDIAALIHGMCGLLRQACADRALVTLPAEVPGFICRIDIGQFKASLLNLVLNARDAMLAGGKLTISMEAVTMEGEAASQADVAPGTYVRVAVTDTGHGVAPENLALVFDPFFTTKPFGAGSGLGLAQVHGFAHQSGGSVSIASTVGVGTTVTMLLPLAAEVAAVAAVSADGVHGP